MNHGARPCDPEEDLCCGCLPQALLPSWMGRAGLAPGHRSPTYAPPLVVSPNDSFGPQGQGGGEDELGRLLNPASARPMGKLAPVFIARELEGVAPPLGNGSGKHHANKSGRRTGDSKKGSGKGSASERGSGGADDDDDDNDVCPTCLEPYAADNPKIVTACGHHFHMGCILEWLERSRACPVCMKPMKFEEPS